MSEQQPESFRDAIATIDEKGKRAWIFPKKPKGRYYNYRTYVSWVLLIFFIGAPFLKVNGNQFLLFNVLERRFSIFGAPFWPQDFYILVLVMLIGVVFITLFTVAFGRVFCGWVCPQTIFLEMVFRKIEYWIDGDRGAQIRLKKSAWTPDKIRKRVIKHSIFVAISFFIANVFLAYFIGSDQLFAIISDSPLNHLSGLISILIFTTLFYFVFTWFREQVCVIACPYGRLQSVLLDDKSIVVAYDYKRGEKEAGRAKFKKNEDRAASGKGDCIDCHQCVDVCPTGIDIRNGTQLECVNCTACIDACDHMMEKVNLPKGLIRFDSESNIAEQKKPGFTWRMKGYTAVLSILTAALVLLIFIRSDLQATVFKLPGQLYELKENQVVSNVYGYKLINKTTDTISAISIKLLSHDGNVQLVGDTAVAVPSQSLSKGTIFIDIPKSELKSSKEKIKIGIYSNDELIETTTTNFLGPTHF